MSDNINSEFQFAEGFKVDDKVKLAYDRNGYVIVRGLLDKEETTKLKNAFENDDATESKSYGRSDDVGRKTKSILWMNAGNDITGMVARSEKVAGTFEKLLGGEVYHFHAKVQMKPPRTGGAHVWHQDYGYWYNDGCMFPHMGTVTIAIDKADRQNGCLQLLVGSHKLGRVEHNVVGEQVGADLGQVELAKTICPLIHAEMEPGDAMFFNCNILHTSARNDSDRRRWMYLVAYNRADNSPLLDTIHPKYTALHKVPNDAIRECTVLNDASGKNFWKGTEEDKAFHRLEKGSG